MNTLIALDKSAVHRVGMALSRAFMQYPLFTYCNPNAAHRERTLHKIFELIMYGALLKGTVYATSSNCEGIAMWLPPNDAYISTVQMWGVLVSMPSVVKAGMGTLLKGIAIGDWETQNRKELAPFPHWFLWLMGVDTPYQGHGMASTLMRPMLSKIDTEGMPCYLETYIEKNVHIYEHFGFRVVKACMVPKTNLSYWAMLREQ